MYLHDVQVENKCSLLFILMNFAKRTFILIETIFSLFNQYVSSSNTVYIVTDV